MVLPFCRSSPPISAPLEPLLRLPKVEPRESSARAIGEVVFLTHKQVLAEAILDREGRWHVPKLPVLDRVLNALYAPERFPDGDKPYGYAALIEVAAWLKGEVRQARG